MNCIILEKNLDIANELSYMLLSFGLKGIVLFQRTEVLKQLETQPGCNLGIIDIDNKSIEGLELMQELNERYGNSFRFIIHSAAAIDEMPANLNEKNVIGYISKPFDNEILKKTIATALNMWRVIKENRFLSQELKNRSGPSDLIGNSPPIQQVRELIQKVAVTKATF